MARTHGAAAAAAAAAAVILQEPGMGVKNICVAVKATPGLEDLKTKDIKQEAIRQRAVLKQAGTAAAEREPKKKSGLDLLLDGGSEVVATKPTTLHPSWKRCETGALLAILPMKDHQLPRQTRDNTCKGTGTADFCSAQSPLRVAPWGVFVRSRRDGTQAERAAGAGADGGRDSGIPRATRRRDTGEAGEEAQTGGARVCDAGGSGDRGGGGGGKGTAGGAAAVAGLAGGGASSEGVAGGWHCSTRHPAVWERGDECCSASGWRRARSGRDEAGVDGAEEAGGGVVVERQRHLTCCVAVLQSELRYFKCKVATLSVQILLEFRPKRAIAEGSGSQCQV